MPNALTKKTAITYIPGTAGVPYNPGSPAAGGYTSVTTRQVCSYRRIGNAADITSLGGATVYGDGAYVYLCAAENLTVSYAATPYIAPTPGIPSTPSQTISDFNFGWNAGARSIASFTVDGTAQFSAATGVLGVVAGLNDVDSNADYRNINHAFYLTKGIARIYENGAEKLYIGAYTAANVFKICRRSKVVRYYIDSTMVYTSLVPSEGEVFIDASLYSGGDSVDNPSITSEAFGTSSASFQPLAAKGGVARTQTGPSSSFLALTTSSRLRVGGNSSFAALTSRGGRLGYGESRAALAALTINAGQYGTAPKYALSAASLSMLSSSGHGFTGTVAQGNAKFAPLQAKAGRAGYAESKASFAPLRAYGHGYEGRTKASMHSAVSARQTLSFFGAFEVLLYSQITGESSLVTLKLNNAAILSSVSADDNITYSAIMQAVMRAVASVHAGVPVFSETSEVWVVNDETGASTTYEGYAFNSFAKYQGKYLGVKTDGVYLLEGNTDAGALVRSSVSFGKQDFGTITEKSVPNCYLGVASDGNLILKVSGNGETYFYKSVRHDDFLRTQRIKLGRGHRANYLTFELFNENGADFEMASVSFEAISLSRRI